MIESANKFMEKLPASKKPSLSDSGEMLYFGISAEYWLEFDFGQKVIYLKGLFDGAMCNGNQLFNVTLCADVSIKKYIEALDAFYQDEANAKIPIPFAIYLASKLLSGAGVFEMYRHLRKVRQATAHL